MCNGCRCFPRLRKDHQGAVVLVREEVVRGTHSACEHPEPGAVGVVPMAVSGESFPGSSCAARTIQPATAEHSLGEQRLANLLLHLSLGFGSVALLGLRLCLSFILRRKMPRRAWMEMPFSSPASVTFSL